MQQSFQYAGIISNRHIQCKLIFSVLKFFLAAPMHLPIDFMQIPPDFI